MGLDVANLLLKISGDPDDAKIALSEVAAELRKFNDAEAQAHIAIAGYDEAKAKLDSLDKSLTVIGHRDVSARVKVNVDDAKAKLQKLKAELDLASAGGAGARPVKDILSDFDTLGSQVERDTHTRFQHMALDARALLLSAGSDLKSNLKKGIVDGLVASVKDVGKALAGVLKTAPAAVGGAAASGIGALVEGGGAAAKGVVSLGASAAGAIGPMGALLGVVLLFAPALLALVASLAGAVAGFGVLAVSFVGVLAPALLLTIGAVKELTQAWQAVTQRQEHAKQSALAVAQAQQGVHTATESLSSSQRNLRLQTDEAYAAWRAQIRAVKEDLLNVKSAQLGVEGATLSYKEALLALKQFRSSVGLEGGKFDDLFKKVTNVDYDPRKLLKDIKNTGVGQLGEKQDVELQRLILNVRQAKLGETQAQESLHTSNEKLQKDRRLENRYIEEGIKAYPAYLSALKEVQSAWEGMATAERNLTRAQLEQSAPLSKLSREQLTLGESLHGFVHDLKALFGPAIKEIFKGVELGLKSVLGLLKDSTLSSAFKQLGGAIGGVFAQLGKALAEPGMRKGLTELVKGSSQLVKTLGSTVLINFIRIFTNLAVAAMPAMLKIVERIGGAFKNWASGSSSTDKLQQKISHIIREFEEWVHLIGALGGLIKAFFHDTSQQGDSLTRSISKTLEKWTAFLNTKAGQEEIKKFFKESIQFAREFIEVVNDIITVIKKLVEILEPVVEGIEAAAGALGEGVFSGSGENTEGKGAGVAATERRNSLRHKTIENANNALKRGHLTTAQRQTLERQRREAEEQLHPPPRLKRQLGGLLGGYGGGDQIPLLGERGEYMLRKEVVNSVGVATLDGLNSTGHIHTTPHTASKDTYIEKVVLPTVPGSSGIDPRVGAVKFARELSRRGLG